LIRIKPPVIATFSFRCFSPNLTGLLFLDSPRVTNRRRRIPLESHYSSFLGSNDLALAECPEGLGGESRQCCEAERCCATVRCPLGGLRRGVLNPDLPPDRRDPFVIVLHAAFRQGVAVPATRRGRERSCSAAEGATGPRKRSGNRDRVGIRDLWKAGRRAMRLPHRRSKGRPARSESFRFRDRGGSASPAPSAGV